MDRIALSPATQSDPETHSGLHPLAALPGFTLRRAATAMMAELAGKLGAIDIRISDATVLLLLDGRQDMTSSRIGELLDIQRANMVPLLARLESAGLIMREPIDRRSSAIVLTDEGQTRLGAIKTIVQDFENSLLDRIPAEHRDHILPALNALLG